jgi:hypothetical protein
VCAGTPTGTGDGKCRGGRADPTHGKLCSGGFGSLSLSLSLGGTLRSSHARASAQLKGTELASVAGIAGKEVVRYALTDGADSSTPREAAAQKYHNEEAAKAVRRLTLLIMVWSRPLHA